MLQGRARIGDGEVAAGQVGGLARDGDALILDSGEDGARFTVFSGPALGRARLMRGSFVASDPAQMQRFMLGAQTGGFGRLAPFAAQTDWTPSRPD